MNEPLLLLPGMMCDARLFAPQIAAFSAERPVMVAPLIGDNTIAGLAQTILRNAPPRFALAGLSMGGIIAMEIVRQAPCRVTRLALMDTNPLADTPCRVARRDALIERVRIGDLRAVMRDELKPNYLSGGSDTRWILDQCMAMADALGEDVFIDQSHALKRREDQQAALSSVRVPTLALCGEDDVLCPVERHQLLCNLIPNARLVVVPRAGHLPTLEQPERTNKALSEWLIM